MPKHNPPPAPVTFTNDELAAAVAAFALVNAIMTGDDFRPYAVAVAAMGQRPFMGAMSKIVDAVPAEIIAEAAREYEEATGKRLDKGTVAFPFEINHDKGDTTDPLLDLRSRINLN